MKICPFCKTNLAGVPDFGPNNRLCPNKDCHELVVPEEVPDKEEDDAVKTGKNPDCFAYHDGRDPACRKCGLAEQCRIEFEDSRPECFGIDYNQHPECIDCIDASQCIEAKKETQEMAKTTRRRRTRVRRKAQEEPVVDVVEEEEVEEVEEVEATTDETDYTEMTIPVLREELESRDLETSGRKSTLIKRLLADDAGDDDEAEEEPAPAPKKTRRKRTKVKDVVDEPVVDEPVEEEATAPVAAEVDVSKIVDLVLAQIAEAINAAIASGPVAAALAPTASVTAAPEEPKSKGLRGKAFDLEVQTDEYTEWYLNDAGGGSGWKSLSQEEKYELADELDVDWEEADDDRVDNMRMTMAVQKHLEITKYKDEYKSAAARKALR